MGILTGLFFLFSMSNDTFAMSQSMKSKIGFDLAAACFQYGFNKESYDYASSMTDGMSDSERRPYLINLFRDQTKCRFLNSSTNSQSLAKSLVAPITRFRNQIPPLMGANLIGDNWLLTTDGNKKFYSPDGDVGPTAILSRYGMNSSVVELAHNGQWGRVQDVVNEVESKRLAGHRYFWLNMMLKGDCCFDWKMPAEFKTNGQIVEADVYQKVEAFAYSSLRTILEKATLPLAAVEFGNELDSGFWTDFDANPTLGNPPVNIVRTKKIIQSAKNGIKRAYKEKNLEAPFFVLHHMGDIYKSRADLLNNLKAFTDTSFVDEALYDALSFSYYSSARDALNPVDCVDLLRSLADELGMPWYLSEFGIPSDLAPGGTDPNGATYAWNNFTDLNLCPSLVGTTCSDLPDMQAKMTKRVMDVAQSSPGFRGGFWLAPQDNVRRNDRNDIAWPTDQYRISFWRHIDFVKQDGSTAKAELLPVAQAYLDVARSVLKPVIEMPGYSCNNNGCTAWVWGRSFTPNSIVVLGQGDSVYLPSETKMETTSIISFTVRKEDEDALKAGGLQIFVLTQHPNYPGLVSNVSQFK